MKSKRGADIYYLHKKINVYIDPLERRRNHEKEKKWYSTSGWAYVMGTPTRFHYERYWLMITNFELIEFYNPLCLTQNFFNLNSNMKLNLNSNMHPASTKKKKKSKYMHWFSHTLIVNKLLTHSLGLRSIFKHNHNGYLVPKALFRPKPLKCLH